MPWEAIKYVSSGLTLVAFVVAAIVVVLKSKIREKERLIKTASEGDRAGLVKDALEFFSVDTSNLPKQRQFDVAMAQIHARQLRFTLIICAVIALALIGACLAAYAMAKAAKGNETTVVSPTEHSASPIAAQKEQFRLQRRTELIALIFETTDGADGKPRPRANARTRSEALKEFVEMERAAKRTVPEPEFIPDLRGARLDGVKLEYIDFSAAGFEGANLEGADFYYCKFCNAVLYKTTASEAQFFDCDLTGAHCRSAVWPKAKLNHVTLASADFEGADLQGVVMNDVILQGTKLASSVLRGATLNEIRSWKEIGSIADADIRDLIHAPEGFVEWARKSGAAQDPRSAVGQKRSPIEGIWSGRWSRIGFDGPRPASIQVKVGRTETILNGTISQQYHGAFSDGVDEPISEITVAPENTISFLWSTFRFKGKFSEDYSQITGEVVRELPTHHEPMGSFALSKV